MLAAVVAKLAASSSSPVLISLLALVGQLAHINACELIECLAGMPAPGASKLSLSTGACTQPTPKQGHKLCIMLTLQLQACQTGCTHCSPIVYAPAPPAPLLRLNDAAAGGQGSALQLVLGLWTERFLEFQGAYHIKLSVSALALLLATRHPALAAAQVRKQGLASMWAGTLSCPSMCYAVML